MKTKYNKISISLILFIFIFFINNTSQAYVKIGYKLTGTWYDDNYYIPKRNVTYKNKTVNYYNIAVNAINAWNNAVNSTSSSPLDIRLTFSSSVSNTKTRISIDPIDRGPTGWRGLANYFYLDSSNRLVPNPQGKFPTKNYVSGSAIINIYYVHDNPNWKIQNTMMHEVGHILGLKHSNTSGALLVSDSAKYNKLVPPQYDDIAGVRSIYK